MANQDTVELLIADAEDLVLGSLFAPQWGIYYQGSPVIQPANALNSLIGGALSDLTALPGTNELLSAIGLPLVPAVASTAEFQYSQDWPISNYPQENGAFQSYNKVTLPWDIRLKLASGGTKSQRQSFLNAVFAIANGTAPGSPLQLLGNNVAQQPQALFDIVTPELTYPSCSCTHVDFARTAKNGVSLIVVDMWFQQIVIASSPNFQNTQQPGDSGQLGIGNQQPVAPSSSVNQSILSGLYT